jgi:hypothetical protein
VFRPDLRPTQPSIQSVPGIVLPVVSVARVWQWPLTWNHYGAWPNIQIVSYIINRGEREHELRCVWKTHICVPCLLRPVSKRRTSVPPHLLHPVSKRTSVSPIFYVQQVKEGHLCPPSPMC